MCRRRTEDLSENVFSESDIPESIAGSTEPRRGGRSAASLRASFLRLRVVASVVPVGDASRREI